MSRSDRIPLAATEPRCEPSRGCTAKTRCARYLASIPQGTPLGDWSAAIGEQSVLCGGFLLSSAIVKDAAAPRPAAKPWPVVRD